MVRFMALGLVLVSVLFNSLWQGGTVSGMIINWSEEKQSKYYSRMKLASFIVISLSFVFLLCLGRFTELNTINILFFICLIPCGVVALKSYQQKTKILETSIVRNHFLNFMVLELPLHYVFLLVWLKLIMVASNWLAF